MRMLKGLLTRLKNQARALKREIVALRLATRDPRTPLAAKLIALAVIAYALSPIDLVPDFVPVLGQVDDLILVPLGLWLAIRLIPREVIEEARARALEPAQLPRSIGAAIIIVTLWIASAAWLAWMLLRDR